MDNKNNIFNIRFEYFNLDWYDIINYLIFPFPSALTETNKYCAAHCASNLILDSTLNSIAQAYADKLVALGYLVYSDNQSCGGNLYFTSSIQAIDINSITGISFKKFLFVFI